MRSTVVLLACFCGLLSGCNRSAGPAGRAQLAQARQHFGDDQFVLAARLLSTFLRQHANTRQADQAYYLRGLCYRRSDPDKPDLAADDFERALSATRQGSLRALINTALGHLYFETRPDEPAKAIEYYRAALDDLDDAPPTDAVLYRLAVSSQKIGQWDQADLYLSRCFNDFADSSFAAYARDRFGARTWRLQVGAFAELDRAVQMTDRLRRNGWSADWRSRRQNDRLLYAVRLGRYDTYAQARHDLHKLHGIEPESRIVPARPVRPSYRQEQQND